MKVKWKTVLSLISLFLVAGNAAAQPAWLDSTMFEYPHSELSQIVQESPLVSSLSAGGHGQPGFFISGFGDIFGAGISFNGEEQDSYLLPFWDALRWPLPLVGKMAINPLPTGKPETISPRLEEVNLHSFWEKNDRPFVRVHYLSRDFGREEIFALFQRRINPTFRVQPFGAIGHYSGWRDNSELAFHQTGVQAEKWLSGRKLLHLLAFSHESEAGFPGPILASWAPTFPNLKRKIQEQRFQGRLRTANADSSTRQILHWQVQRLSEEWTNQGPYFHRRNEEIAGQMSWLRTGRWRTQNWWIVPSAAVHRIRYHSKTTHVWQVGIQLGNWASLSENWQGSVQAHISLGNWKKREASLVAGLAGKRAKLPKLWVRFSDSRGGFLPPVLRDSTSFHWYWICATPLFQAAQRSPRQSDFRLLEEKLAWPVWKGPRRSLVVQVQNVHWLQMPGAFSSPARFHAANLGVWLRAGDWYGFSAEGVANFRGASSKKTLLTSALPAVSAAAAVGFRHVFFQGDLHALVKMIVRVHSARRGNVSRKIGATQFVAMPAAAFWDFYAHFRVADLRFFLAFENILNNADATLPGYPVPGRRFRFGLVWDFWN